MRLTRIERDLVARYDAETGGHFGPHRDDTGMSVAHRRFAVSINLNADFDGGEISFPEYSPQAFKAAPGTAIVFSASILHQVSRVTRGQRYVFLTFLFDEEAERLRQSNLRAVLRGSGSLNWRRREKPRRRRRRRPQSTRLASVQFCARLKLFKLLASLFCNAQRVQNTHPAYIPI